MYQIVGQLSLDKQKEDGEFHFLTKVAFEWARLKAGETILMQLVQFYMLLHSQLAHSLTFEEVQTITISDVLSKHVNLQSLYDKVKRKSFVHTLHTWYNLHFLQLVTTVILKYLKGTKHKRFHHYKTDLYLSPFSLVNCGCL